MTWSSKNWMFPPKLCFDISIKVLTISSLEHPSRKCIRRMRLEWNTLEARFSDPSFKRPSRFSKKKEINCTHWHFVKLSKHSLLESNPKRSVCGFILQTQQHLVITPQSVPGKFLAWGVNGSVCYRFGNRSGYFAWSEASMQESIII